MPGLDKIMGMMNPMGMMNEIMQMAQQMQQPQGGEGGQKTDPLAQLFQQLMQGSSASPT